LLLSPRAARARQEADLQTQQPETWSRRTLTGLVLAALLLGFAVPRPFIEPVISP
jgi:hypothetical protein